jgi:thymidylate synthase (FAD)
MFTVTPSVYLIGYTTIDEPGLERYLRDTDQMEFLTELKLATDSHEISMAEAICSFYAKLCYNSLVTGKNKNVKKVRSIRDNLGATLDSAHGSVFEHAWLNFVVVNVSRICTHEMVRHRQGVAWSQESGRYCTPSIFPRMVMDPITQPYLSSIQRIMESVWALYWKMYHDLITEQTPFDEKKKITSALRRILPNGIPNQIGMSINLRALRHIVQMRTSRHAEFEIRKVFNEVFLCVRNSFPMIFCDAKMETVDGLIEVTGMKTQPYEGQ